MQTNHPDKQRTEEQSSEREQHKQSLRVEARPASRGHKRQELKAQVRLRGRPQDTRRKQAVEIRANAESNGPVQGSLWQSWEVVGHAVEPRRSVSGYVSRMETVSACSRVIMRKDAQKFKNWEAKSVETNELGIGWRWGQQAWKGPGFCSRQNWRTQYRENWWDYLEFHLG